METENHKSQKRYTIEGELTKAFCLQSERLHSGKRFNHCSVYRHFLMISGLFNQKSNILQSTLLYPRPKDFALASVDGGTRKVTVCLQRSLFLHRKFF